jgi:hypothetical protein
MQCPGTPKYGSGMLRSSHSRVAVSASKRAMLSPLSIKPDEIAFTRIRRLA